jgi:hypothetical protein
VPKKGENVKVWNATEQDIRAAAEEVGVAIHSDWAGTGIVPDGRALRFRLAVNTAERREDGTLPYQRVSQSTWQGQRRVAAVCWHGHRDFMRALFASCPDARLKTALADYRGADDFEAKYLDTFGTGNAYNVAYGQACVCEEVYA